MTHYLEFDSTYRNRNLYPNPASFVMEISQTGQKSKEGSVDPISNTSPILAWNNSFQETTASNTSDTNLVIDTTFSPSDQTILKITTAAAGGIRRSNNFYVGAVIRVVSSIDATVYLRRIVKYEYLGITSGPVENAIITVDSPFPIASFEGNAVIENPTPIPTNTSNAVIKFFIPGSVAGNNYYLNYYVHDITSNEYRQITAFDGTTHLATLASATSIDWSTSGNANRNFVIRKDIPVNSGTLRSINTVAYGSTSATYATAKAIQLASTASDVSDAYNGGFIRMITPAPVSGSGFSRTLNPYGAERRIARYIAGDGTLLVASGGTTVTLNPATSSSVDNFYVGAILTDVTAGSSAEIIGYTGSTRVATLAVSLTSSVAGDVWQIRTAILETPLPMTTGTFATITATVNFVLSADASSIDNYYVGYSLTDITVSPQQTRVVDSYTGSTRTGTVSVAWGAGVANGDKWIINATGYEIELYSRDNCNPFAYYGSLTSVQEMCCYEVELINLILPNTDLAAGKGGRPVFYPYMYVELQQVSASSGNQRGMIYSNNPNAYKMMFRAVLDDTSTFVASPFIKIDSDGMVQTVKFKPTDSFKFSVYLPGGDLFKTVASDTTSPTEPNALVQISAAFAFKRI